MTGILIRGERGRSNIQAQGRRPRAEWSRSHQKLDEAGNGVPLRASRGTNPAHILILDFRPLEPGENPFLLFLNHQLRGYLL